MPPRLPPARAVAASAARPKGHKTSHSLVKTEVVQLGFLLPWAARGVSSSSSLSLSSTESSSSSTANEPGPTTSSSSTRPSPTSFTSVAPTQHSSSFLAEGRPTSSRTSSSSPSPSFIHHTLLHPNPPPPSDLLNHLKARPHLLTRSSGGLLSRYARRVGNLKVERSVEELMVRQRVGVPIYPSSRWKGKAKIVGVEEDRDAYFALPLTAKSTKKTLKHPLRTNKWALDQYPPLATLQSRRYTSKELLSHIHWLILGGQAPAFDIALGLLCTSVDWAENKAVGHAQARHGEQPNTSTSEETGQRWEALGMLDLYLAYSGGRARKRTQQLKQDNDALVNGRPSTYPSALLEIYLKHNPSGRPPNRQTLHLLVLASLTYRQAPSASNPSSPSDSPDSFIGADSPPIEQTTDVDIDILGLIAGFRSAHRLTPGPETWRHVALTALRVNDESLAKGAWKGWYASMRRAESEMRVEKGNTGSKVSGRPIAKGGETVDRSAEVVRRSVLKPEDIRIRFSHLGTQKRRWKEVVKAMEEKGWLRRGDKKSYGGYAWVEVEDVEELGRVDQAPAEEESQATGTAGNSSRDEGLSGKASFSQQSPMSVGQPSPSEDRPDSQLSTHPPDLYPPPSSTPIEYETYDESEREPARATG